jgi:sterol desaturase/sphingolipid hydroxylase (fatty acid hydroxylase superfamily)
VENGVIFAQAGYICRMNIFHELYQEVLSFSGLEPLMEMYRTGNYQPLRTAHGLFSALSPVIPLILFFEIARALVYKRFRIEDYRMPFFIFVANRVIGRFISIAVIGFCIGHLEKFAIFRTTFTWYWLIYGYVAWELSHFVYHYFAHKVRLFWCLHSTHHAPQAMNLSVSYAHFFLEGAYADVIRTSICIVLGVNPPLLFFIMIVDGMWGAFIHVGENFMRDARMGFLGRIILTPSHHRVHHAKNPLYMDTNFCNLLNIWDKVFKTYQPEEKSTEIEYGITRAMNPRNFLDVYFGEFYYLAKDIGRAPGLKNKFLYVIMPPGWSHTGDHRTAAVVKREFAGSPVTGPADKVKPGLAGKI